MARRRRRIKKHGKFGEYKIRRNVGRWTMVHNGKSKRYTRKIKHKKRRDDE